MANILPSTTSSALLLFAAFLFLLLTSTGAGKGSNLLSAGETLTYGEALYAGDYNLFMQEDCNLVINKDQIPVWESRTAGMGSKCFLHFQVNGELLIISPNDTKPVWRTETGGPSDRFTLVLKPNGNAVVFGSTVWSTGTMKGFKAKKSVH